MSSKAFDKLRQGLEEARAYMEGEREGYKVTVLPASDPARKPKSKAFEAIHSAVTGMSRAGTVDQETVRQFDQSCLKSTECPSRQSRKPSKR